MPCGSSPRWMHDKARKAERQLRASAFCLSTMLCFPQMNVTLLVLGCGTPVPPAKEWLGNLNRFSRCLPLKPSFWETKGPCCHCPGCQSSLPWWSTARGPLQIHGFVRSWNETRRFFATRRPKWIGRDISIYSIESQISISYIFKHVISIFFFQK